MPISALLHSGDTAPSEDASEHDLLNSDSENSDEEELNPDDYSEDVTSTLLMHSAWFQAAAHFCQYSCLMPAASTALPTHRKVALKR